MTTPAAAQDFQRTTLLVLVLAVLLGAALLVLVPFLPALLWAITIVVATWPVLLRLEARLRGHRGLAVTLMTVALLALLLVPVYLAIATLFRNAERITGLVASLDTRALPPPPAWLASIPILGPKASQAWLHQTEGGGSALVVQLKPYAIQALKVLASKIGSLGGVVFHGLVTILIAAMLYAQGEAASLMVRRFARRLAGEQGEAVMVLAGKAIRSVALGVVVTALVQAVLAGLGFAFAGVPYAGVLTAVALLLSLAQVGPGPLLIPAVIWLFVAGRTGHGVFLGIWSIMPLTVDNFLRPYFIRKGVDLPLWLIFAGVMGGLLAFGVLGLFLGPVVLAVLYTLTLSWVDELGPEPS